MKGGSDQNEMEMEPKSESVTARQVKSDEKGVAAMKTSQNSFTGRKKCHFHHRIVENGSIWGISKKDLRSV